MKNGKIEVQGREIALMSVESEDYISLTDIAKYRNSNEPFAVINNWVRNRSTIEFIGLWERLNNRDFKPLEFERFKMESGTNYFVLSPQKWIESTNAKGIISKSGRYGGTFAHEDDIKDQLQNSYRCCKRKFNSAGIIKRTNKLCLRK